jgi:pyruvate,water dikinase
MIENVIREAHEAGHQGRAARPSAERPSGFAKFLVARGIDSMSASPDSFIAVKRHVAAAEAKSSLAQARSQRAV